MRKAERAKFNNLALQVPQIEAAGLRVPPAELHETDYRLGEGNGCSHAQEHGTNNRDQPDDLA